MRLFVGLGNPGSRYARNRHNIGFMAVDEIARVHNAGPWRKRFQGEAADAIIGGEKVLILKPQTFMNLSGQSVGEAQNFFKIPLADVTVFYDELDLPPAKLRVKIGGGNAGHNGLRSISAHCGNDYRRVRLGIGHPGLKPLVQSHVLGDFAKSEEPWVEDLCRIIADNAALLAKGEDGSFQNKVHLAMEARGWTDVKRPGEKANQTKE
ncbi:aminoacyl-tRNA hydrolase [Microvirga guangxiensis]|uniref:Peptidyl-tRNA hydrolase n=1 Tax=Microvirga guangxiensis TaxID=549386 RepID=A0A1G5L8H6_9HYPH|nr:aminoacyl-tRNA hydrolase [Microvirga guangxiensis]SCZ09263.1 peptidyl-tRNA hydrolase, PTH1 family [Microvirga guangxiensis]